MTPRAQTEGKPGRVLVVGEAKLAGADFAELLVGASHSVETVADGEKAREYLVQRSPEVILLDLDLPDGNGLDLLPDLKELDQLAAILVSGSQADAPMVVEAMRRGADNFLTDNLTREDFLECVDRALQRHRTERRALVYQEAVESRLSGEANEIPELLGTSRSIQRVRDLTAIVAETDASVVLLGETGTGKGLVARAIHRLSNRASASFVDVNCATLPRDLVESEIFGHEKGAFTGAAEQKPGLLEIGHGGTVFFDEIGELQLSAQSKLVKAIEDRYFRRVGGIKEVSVDVRFLAATHVDLEMGVREGSFREDLFYRLNVFQIPLPPLRERGEDIAQLALHFVKTLNPYFGRQSETISGEAQRLLLRYDWPGNVRELRNVVERAMILARHREISPSHLPKNLKATSRSSPRRMPSLAEVETEHIRKVLEMTESNMRQTAEILGISRSTLYAKLRKAGVEIPKLRKSKGRWRRKRG